MRPLWLAAAFLACGGGTVRAPQPWPAPGEARGEFAEPDRFVPSYERADISRALERERGAEASAERMIAELAAREPSPAIEDQLRVARADLEVRRRFIHTLETCQASGRWCPPRLDDPPWSYDPDPPQPVAPPVTAPLRFDLASWRTLAAELHGRACACRTLACVDSVGVAIHDLEQRPMPAVQGDDIASLSITRARECLHRLRR